MFTLVTLINVFFILLNTFIEVEKKYFNTSRTVIRIITVLWIIIFIVFFGIRW